MYNLMKKRIAVKIRIIDAILIYDKKIIYIRLIDTTKKRCIKRNSIINKISIYIRWSQVNNRYQGFILRELEISVVIIFLKNSCNRRCFLYWRFIYFITLVLFGFGCLNIFLTLRWKTTRQRSVWVGLRWLQLTAVYHLKNICT